MEVEAASVFRSALETGTISLPPHCTHQVDPGPAQVQSEKTETQTLQWEEREGFVAILEASQLPEDEMS